MSSESVSSAVQAETFFIQFHMMTMTTRNLDKQALVDLTFMIQCLETHEDVSQSMRLLFQLK